ncbi:hypothetical protein Tco_1048006, partial [Tanacetum coccineum]
QTYDNCHTPWNGRTQHEDVVADGDELPFTQLCIELSDRVCTEFLRTNEPQDVPEFKTLDQPKRLNFDDGEELGLNITQPPATQGKEVGDGQNTEPQEPQDVPEFKTPDQPKGASIKIASGAIDMFTYVLNDAERSKNKQTAPRLFCHTAMLVALFEDYTIQGIAKCLGEGDRGDVVA